MPFKNGRFRPFQGQLTPPRAKTVAYGKLSVFFPDTMSFAHDYAVVKLSSHRWGIPNFETTRLYGYRAGNDSFYALYVVLDDWKVDISQMVHLSKHSIQEISA